MTLMPNKTREQSMDAASVGGRQMGSFKQRISETITYLVNYSNWLADGETIASADIIVFPTTTPPVVISGKEIQEGNLVLFQFDNGQEGAKYALSIDIHTSTGQIKRDYFTVTVGNTSPVTSLPDVVSELGQAQAAKVAAEAAQAGAQAAAATADADKITVAGYKADVSADRTQTGLDRTATAADRVQTGLDRVQTGLDAAATAADRTQTGLDRVATAADRVQTGLDAAATAADRTQTGLDRAAAAASAADALAAPSSVFLKRLSTISALKAIAPTTAYDVILSGYTTTGDGGGGQFRGVTGASAGTYVDNGGTIILPTGGNGSAAWLRIWDGPLNLAYFGNTAASEAAANAIFNTAVSVIGSAGAIFNPKGSLVNFANVTIPLNVIVYDEAGEQIVVSNQTFGKSTQASGGHFLLRSAKSNTPGRLYIEPNGAPNGTSSKLDMFFDSYETDGVNYRVMSQAPQTYDPTVPVTLLGSNGVAMFAVKGTGGTAFGVPPMIVWGFSDLNNNVGSPMKLVYFDTSDSTWRTPLKGGWKTGLSITTGDYILASNKIYQAASTGATGNTIPSHGAGTVSDGGVSWTFIRDFAASSGNFRSIVLLGARDDMPKFGYPNVGTQFSKDAMFWNAKKVVFVDNTDANVWNIYNPNLSDDLYIETGDAARRMRFDNTGQFIQVVGLALSFNAVTAADGDTTPSVKGARTFVVANTAPTTITNFTNGIAWQEIIVRATTNNTTIKNNANIILAGGADITLTGNQAIYLQANSGGNIWSQIKG